VSNSTHHQSAYSTLRVGDIDRTLSALFIMLSVERRE